VSEDDGGLQEALQPLSERPSAPTGATLRGKDSSASIEAKLSQGKATEAVARAAGLSARTFQRIEMAGRLLARLMPAPTLL
jgi:hypothetical protein